MFAADLMQAFHRRKCPVIVQSPCVSRRGGGAFSHDPECLIPKRATGILLGLSLLSDLFAIGRWAMKKNVAFWHDTWVDECSLKIKFWDILVICQQQDSSVAQV